MTAATDAELAVSLMFFDSGILNKQSCHLQSHHWIHQSCKFLCELTHSWVKLPEIVLAMALAAAGLGKMTDIEV